MAPGLIRAGSGVAVQQLLGQGQGRQACRQPCIFAWLRLALALGLLGRIPDPDNFLNVRDDLFAHHAVFVKNVPVSPQQLFIQRLRNVVKIEVPLLGCNQRVQQDLEVQVPEFLLEQLGILFGDRVQNLIAFLDQVGPQGFMGQGLGPGAFITQDPHRSDQLLGLRWVLHHAPMLAKAEPASAQTQLKAGSPWGTGLQLLAAWLRGELVGDVFVFVFFVVLVVVIVEQVVVVVVDVFNEQLAHFQRNESGFSRVQR